MRAVTRGPVRRSGWGLLRRGWPVAAVVAAGLGVLGSPGLQALLTTLIWVSWLLVAFCAITSSPRARGLGRRLATAGGELAATVLRPLLVQGRRLRSRVRGEISAGERS